MAARIECTLDKNKSLPGASLFKRIPPSCAQQQAGRSAGIYTTSKGAQMVSRSGLDNHILCYARGHKGPPPRTFVGLCDARLAPV